MSDLAGGFDLNVRLEEDDNNNAAFDLNQPIDDNSNAVFHFLIRLQCLYHFNWFICYYFPKDDVDEVHLDEPDDDVGGVDEVDHDGVDDDDDGVYEDDNGNAVPYYYWMP